MASVTVPGSELSLGDSVFSSLGIPDDIIPLLNSSTGPHKRAHGVIVGSSSISASFEFDGKCRRLTFLHPAQAIMASYIKSCAVTCLSYRGR